MMLFNSMGQRLGMLSGGCLEGDLLAQARRVLRHAQAKVVRYDLADESDSLWQQGMGCGGVIDVLLQPVARANAYLGLEKVHERLEAHRSCVYQQRVDDMGLTSEHWRVSPPSENDASGPSVAAQSRAYCLEENNQRWLATPIRPAPHLVIFGGGQDARPLAQLARDIGWRITVVDARVGYASAEDFPECARVQLPAGEMGDMLGTIDAIVIMTHNLSLDAEALVFAHTSGARYIGMLGPTHRRTKVERLAGVAASEFKQLYCGPIGLDIGAILPETIALAILSQCHLVIEGEQRSESAELATVGMVL